MGKRGISPYLRLARVSNLPTVWSNVLCALWLAGGGDIATTLLLLIATSLFYSAGMYLNDYYDLAFDREHRPERPLPSGELSPKTVQALAFAMLLGASFICVSLSMASLLWALFLMVFIFWYNLHHKQNAWSPFIMAGCRLWLYPLAGSAVLIETSWVLWAAGGTMYFYVLALSFLARKGFSFWGICKDREFSVGLLIAGMALVDLCVLSAAGILQVDMALLLTAFFIVTLLLQKKIPGT